MIQSTSADDDVSGRREEEESDELVCWAAWLFALSFNSLLDLSFSMSSSFRERTARVKRKGRKSACWSRSNGLVWLVV